MWFCFILLIVAIVGGALGLFLSNAILWAITIVSVLVCVVLIIYFKIEYDDHEPLDKLGLFYGLVWSIVFLLPMWVARIFLR